MRWSMSCLMALALAAGCSTYGTSKHHDAGTDGGADAGDGRVDPGACSADPALPVSLEIGDDPWDCWQGWSQIGGSGQVVYNTPPDPDSGWSEVWIWFEEEAVLARFRIRLPDGYGPPVRLGERLNAWSSVDCPWWINQEFGLTEIGSDDRRFFIRSADFHWEGEPPACEPVEAECSLRIYPTKAFEPHLDLPAVVLGQGGSAYVCSPDRLLARQIFVGSMYLDLEQFCTDMPGGWLSYAELDPTDHSQCTCRDDTQCALAEVCDTSTGRCVLDRCQVGFACAPGEVCDPFSGVCQPEPINRCTSDADCDEMQICNTHTGDCVEDVCMLMDCIGQCSSLLGSCYGCLSDCECWPGVCDPIARACDPACQADKIDFTQDNPDVFAQFIVCLDERMEGAPELLEQYTGAVQCKVDVPAGTCDQGVDQACVGSLQFTPDGRLDPAQWTGLCALTRLPVVTRIRGIYDWP